MRTHNYNGSFKCKELERGYGWIRREKQKLQFYKGFIFAKREFIEKIIKKLVFKG